MTNTTDASKQSEVGVVMYESAWCGYCRAAKRLLDAKGWPYKSLSVDGNSELRAQMQTLSGRTSVPQIFFGDRHIGGFDDLAELEDAGQLDAAFDAIPHS